jgi:hypothetical protein
MLVKYALSDGISQAFLPFRFVDVIVITDQFQTIFTSRADVTT